ncbi:MAG TPA: DinB family protein [Chitinophagales bacterium]|nr:DinB family protein [Chitinophagales bacterium]
MNELKRQGAIGALLDIYEQSISELKNLIADIPDSALTIITDPKTTDEDCKSIQTILTHVVNSGYGYATSIHNLKGHSSVRPDKILRGSVKEYQQDLDNVFTYTENVFKEIKNNEIEEFNEALKIKTRWGQSYDIEQLTEHAIVHILRHKRQINNIMKRL